VLKRGYPEKWLLSGSACALIDGVEIIQCEGVICELAPEQTIQIVGQWQNIALF